MGADDNIRSYFSNHLRPPLVLLRRGDAGYSVIVYPLRLLRYCIFYAGHFAIVFPQQSSPVIAVCPSPTGEVRWGLMTMFGVTSLINFGPLSFSPVGEMQVTPLLYFLITAGSLLFFIRRLLSVFNLQ